MGRNFTEILCGVGVGAGVGAGAGRGGGGAGGCGGRGRGSSLEAVQLYGSIVYYLQFTGRLFFVRVKRAADWPGGRALGGETAAHPAPRRTPCPGIGRRGLSDAPRP